MQQTIVCLGDGVSWLWLLIVFVCPLCNYPSYISCPSRSSFLLMCLHQHFIIPPGIITIAYFPFLFYILFIYLFIFCFTYNLRPFPSAQDLGKSLNFHQSVASREGIRHSTLPKRAYPNCSPIYSLAPFSGLIPSSLQNFLSHFSPILGFLL